MASPKMLDAVFCNRLPGGVSDLLFELGFHIWLAKPHSMRITLFDPTPPQGTTPMPRNVSMNVDIETIVWMVARDQLAVDSGVDHDKYWDRMIPDYRSTDFSRQNPEFGYQNQDRSRRTAPRPLHRFTITGDGVPGVLDLPDGLWTAEVVGQDYHLFEARPSVWRGPRAQREPYESLYFSRAWVCFGDSADLSFPADMTIFEDLTGRHV